MLASSSRSSAATACQSKALHVNATSIRYYARKPAGVSYVSYVSTQRAHIALGHRATHPTRLGLQAHRRQTQTHARVAPIRCCTLQSSSPSQTRTPSLTRQLIIPSKSPSTSRSTSQLVVRAATDASLSASASLAASTALELVPAAVWSAWALFKPAPSQYSPEYGSHAMCRRSGA